MAAKRKGKMFGEDKPVQRNKESEPGYTNRSPGRSNAAKSTPSLREDVGLSVRDDVGRIQRRNEPTRTELGRQARADAASRATRRMVGRATAVGTAAMAGYDVGSALNDKYKVSDRVVEALPKSKAEKQVNLENRRDSEMENFRAGPRMDTDGNRLRDVNEHKWKGTM